MQNDHLRLHGHAAVHLYECLVWPVWTVEAEAVRAEELVLMHAQIACKQLRRNRAQTPAVAETPTLTCLLTWWCTSTVFCQYYIFFVTSCRSVSGKKLCSSCAQPLGKGAAMIIETLGLYFHIQCFKVCQEKRSTHSFSKRLHLRIFLQSDLNLSTVN